MRCLACHRELKDEESIKRKLGPVCFQRHGKTVQTELEFYQPLPERFRGLSMLEQARPGDEADEREGLSG